jgi:hypothetical protein
VKIRITGLPGEVDQALAAITSVPSFDVIQADGPYPNRGSSRMVRVYLEIRLRQ